MSIRATPAFPIHNENDNIVHRSILKPNDIGNRSFGPVIPVDSVVKPTLAPKSERKALSTLNNNTLNTRGLSGLNNSLTGKRDSSSIILKPTTMDKKPKIQFVPVSIPTPITSTADSIYIPPDEELVCSGSSSTQRTWDDAQDPLNNSLLQYEKLQLLRAADEERELDRVEQEERDRQRAENVMLEELAKEMTDMFEDDFASIDYFN